MSTTHRPRATGNGVRSRAAKGRDVERPETQPEQGPALKFRELSFPDRALVVTAGMYVCAIPYEANAALTGISWTFLAGLLLLATWLLSLAAVARKTVSGRRLDLGRIAPLWHTIIAFWFVIAATTVASMSLDIVQIAKIRSMLAVCLVIPGLARAFMLSGSLILKIFMIPCSLIAVQTLANLDGVGQVAIAGLNENGQAYLLAVASVWAVWFSLGGAGRARYLFGVAAVLCLFGTLGTGSRTGAITALASVPIGILVGLKLTGRKSVAFVWTIVIALGVAVGWIVIRPLLPQRLSSTNSFQGDGLGGRIPLWQSALDNTEEWFFTGIGLGHSDVYGIPVEGKPQVLHNAFMSVVTETGIFGLLAFLAVGFATVSVARKGHNIGLVLVALAPTVLFMTTLSAEYYKLLWLFPAIAAGGCWNYVEVRQINLRRAGGRPPPRGPRHGTPAVPGRSRGPGAPRVPAAMSGPPQGHQIPRSHTAPFVPPSREPGLPPRR